MNVIPGIFLNPHRCHGRLVVRIGWKFSFGMPKLRTLNSRPIGWKFHCIKLSESSELFRAAQSFSEKKFQKFSKFGLPK